MASRPYRTEGYELDARETGIAWDWDSSLQTGTDDQPALQEGLDWLATKGGGTLRLPFDGDSDGGAIGSELIVPGGVALVGADPSGSVQSSTLVGTGTSGAVVRIKERAAALQGFAVTSSNARWAVATSATMHGIFCGGDDAAGIDVLSKTRIEDVFVLRQPGDGFHAIGSLEHGLINRLWVRGCKRHAAALDDGTRAGYTNKPSAGPFMLPIKGFRALDCGGNALLVGKSGHTQPPRHIYLEMPEALGCGWDTTAREHEEQIALIGGQITVFLPDCEDQQYAQSTINASSDSKTARATPSGGIYFAGSGLKLTGGHYSSLIKSLTVAPGATAISVDFTNAVFITGTYGVAQAVGTTIPGGCTGEARFTSSSALTKVATAQGTDMTLALDGKPYLASAISALDVGLYNGRAPVEYTIASGTLTAPSCNVIVRGEGGVADTVANLRPVSGQVFPQGARIVTHYGGEDITFLVAGNFITRSGADEILSATNPIITWISNGTKLVQQ